MISRLLLFIFGIVYSLQVWGYAYDAESLVHNQGNVEFESQYQRYDDTPNLCNRCINPSVENLQKKTQGGSFFAFEVGLLVAKGVTKRPSGFRKKTVQDAWDNATDGSKPGTKACPTCKKDVEVALGQGRRDWDVDHQPPWSTRDLSGKTRKEVLDEYNRGTRLECPGCNRSRGAKPAE